MGFFISFVFSVLSYTRSKILRYQLTPSFYHTLNFHYVWRGQKYETVVTDHEVNWKVVNCLIF